MEEKEKTIELLEDIKASLRSIDARQETDEVFAETNKLISQVEERVEHSTHQIQNSFDRVHDIVFNFNNIMIGAYLVLGTFPTESPIMPLWTIVFPIANLIYLIVIEVLQMEIHRFASNEKNWTDSDRSAYGKKNRASDHAISDCIISILALSWIHHLFSGILNFASIIYY